MPDSTFRALVLRQNAGSTLSRIEELPVSELPAAEVLVSVAYSSLNYKDGLALAGRGNVVRRYPMVPGIDLAGTVLESRSPRFRAGDSVVMTSCGGGETFWGGYAQLACLSADCLTAVPEGISLRQAAGIGTAGFTAMQCVWALERHGLKPDRGEVLVTGAGGGVGSVAVAILAKLGYQVAAATGRPELHDSLRSLGASRVLDRNAVSAPGKGPLDSQRWVGAIDPAGGETLAGVLRSLASGASVAACGVAGGGELNTTVYPFILRGVSLLGIDSVRCSPELRTELWTRLARDLPAETLDRIIRVVPLAQVPELAAEILGGRVSGRIAIDVTRD